MSEDRINLADLKKQSPADLVTMAEELEVENASTMRKGEMMFQIQGFSRHDTNLHRCQRGTKWNFSTEDTPPGRAC